MRLNTLLMRAIERGGNQRGLIRKVSIGIIGQDSVIEWQWRNNGQWQSASSELDAQELAKQPTY